MLQMFKMLLAFWGVYRILQDYIWLYLSQKWNAPGSHFCQCELHGQPWTKMSEHPATLLPPSSDPCSHSLMLLDANHAQNIFIHEDGSLKLIDNERSLYSNRFHAADSVFLPTTKKYMINVIENAWVNKYLNWPSGKVRRLHRQPCKIKHSATHLLF